MTTFGGCTVPFVYGGAAACTLNPTFVVSPDVWSVAPPPDGLGSRIAIDPAGNQIGFDTSGAPPSVVVAGGGVSYERYTREINLVTGASSNEVNNTVTNVATSANTQASAIQGTVAFHRNRLVSAAGQPTFIMGTAGTSVGVVGCTQPNGASSFFAIGNTLVSPQSALYDAPNNKLYFVPAGDAGVNESLIIRFSPTSNVFEVSGVIDSSLSPPGMGATQIVGLSEDNVWVQKPGTLAGADLGTAYLQRWDLALSTVTEFNTGFTSGGTVLHVFCDEWVVAPGTGGDDVDILDLTFTKVQGFDFNTPGGFDNNAVLIDLHTLFFPLRNEIWAISE